MLIYLFYFDIFSLINSIHSHFYLVTCLLIPLCQVKSNVWQDLELSPMFRARLSSTPTPRLSHLCFTPFVFPGPPPHSVACIISVSGTLGHIDILERCNGKLRISISRHKLPAPLCHAPRLRPSLCCCLRSVSIRFDLVSFCFASLRFATVSTCVLLRLEKPFLSFPFLGFPFPFSFSILLESICNFRQRPQLPLPAPSRGKVFISFVWRNASTGGTQLPLLQAS